ncbi:MAG: XRE family transcriptional regulator [Microbacteriaceae bacterium]|nr:XRE family transcriptional regulator [Microbacteriaceae bacterium]MCL2794027.1 XRE family transcriptional regulator [Microbacteriaceae bacterium]
MHQQVEGPTSTALAHLAGNVRRRRAELGLSQARLAEESGLSRRTIISIEAGEANIGLTAVDRLALALDTSFSALVSGPAAAPTAIGEVMWRGQDSSSTAMLLGVAPATSEAQLWAWVLGPGERYTAEPDPAGWHEMLFVTSGRLTVEFGDATIVIDEGRHAIYSSAQPYAYANLSDHAVAFTRVVVS